MAEYRRKKQSMLCFCGRRAGKPSAIARKRSIVNAIAGLTDANNAVASLTKCQTKTRYDIDPLERKLQEGCVDTMHPRKRLAAECRGRDDTPHAK